MLPSSSYTGKFVTHSQIALLDQRKGTSASVRRNKVLGKHPFMFTPRNDCICPLPFTGKTINCVYYFTKCKQTSSCHLLPVSAAVRKFFVISKPVCWCRHHSGLNNNNSEYGHHAHVGSKLQTKLKLDLIHEMLCLFSLI